MKKSKVLIAMGLCTMLLATGCGKNDTAANKYKDYVDLAKYKGIEVVPTSTEVTDQEIEDMITQNLNNKSEDKEVKGRAVKDGDTVTIDFVGKVDGKEFEGGSAEDYKLVIGSHSFVDDFEEQLIGSNIKDVVDVNVTFPEDYQKEELAGKDANFTVTVKGISEKVVPELTDAWVKENSEQKTVDEYRKALRNQKQAEKNEIARTNKTADVLTTIVENSKIKDYPKDEVDNYVTTMIDYYKSMAPQLGVDYKTFVTQYLGKTEKQFEEEAEKMAKDTVAREMVCFLIADKEGMTVSEEDYNAGVEKYVSEGKADTAEALEKQYGKEAIEQNILLEKVLDFITESAVEVDSLDKTAK